jgi:hypothetical protein
LGDAATADADGDAAIGAIVSGQDGSELRSGFGGDIGQRVAGPVGLDEQLG